MFMVVSIGINQFFVIGFFINFKQNMFKAAAFIHFCVFVAGAYLIFSSQPWEPAKKSKFMPRATELQSFSMSNRNSFSRRVWNDTKGDIETIQEYPDINIQEAEMLQKKFSKSIIKPCQLCTK